MKSVHDPRAAFVAVLLASGLGAALADPLHAVSYDMINGDNSSIGTSLRDDSYTGSGNKLIPYAALSGGLGDLSDGIVAPSNWNITPGPFVGWRDFYLPSPTITFHFAEAVNLDQVNIHINKGYSPSSVDLSMGGTTRNFAVSMGISGAANDWVTFSGVALSGDTLLLRLNDRPAEYISGVFLARDWILISEVSFDGTAAAVPEPASYALLLAGGMVVGAAARRQRR